MAKFHTHIKQLAKWQFCVFESLYAYLENGGQTNILNHMIAGTP